MHQCVALFPVVMVLLCLLPSIDMFDRMMHARVRQVHRGRQGGLEMKWLGGN